MSHTWTEMRCSLGHVHRVDNRTKCDVCGAESAINKEWPIEATISDVLAEELITYHACSVGCLNGLVELVNLDVGRRGDVGVDADISIRGAEVIVGLATHAQSIAQS